MSDTGEPLTDLPHRTKEQGRDWSPNTRTLSEAEGLGRSRLKPLESCPEL